LAAIYDAFTARFAVLAARAFARFATNAAFRAGDSFLFGAFFFGGAACFLEAAHRFRWASPMRFLAAALIFRRLRVDASGVVAVSVEPPGSMARSSAIWPSILVFCASNPSMAATIISGVSFGGMLLDLSRSSHRKDDAVIHTTPELP
jgi:hypothetical protein